MHSHRMSARLRWLTLLFVVGVYACGASLKVRPDGSFEVPEAAQNYSTEPRPNGVMGGRSAEQLETTLLSRLQARGDSAQPDGALAAVAIWMLNETYSGRALDPFAVQMAGMRFGFPGQMFGFLASSGQPPPSAVDERLSAVPRNLRITRYGIATGRRGREVAMVLGASKASLADFPRTSSVGGTLRLNGETSAEFQRASVFVTGSDGAVRELRMASRKIDAEYRFDRPGTYKVEVMGTARAVPRFS